MELGAGGLGVKIGIDIGNVIIGGGEEDTFFTDEYLITPEVKYAKKSIASIWKERPEDEVHFISKANLTTENKTVHWLEWHDFFGVAFLRHRLHFVRKRHLKAPMAQALELDIFIDDRQDIIDSLQGVVKFPILFTSWEETNKQLKEIFEAA